MGVTYRLERSNLRTTLISSDIIHRHSTFHTQAQVCRDRHALIGPVLGLEVDVGRPVVAKVLGVRAASARGKGRRVVVVGGHAGVE
jgi:hypothetical protein